MARRAPECLTGRCTIEPLAFKLLSRFPPCFPAGIVGISPDSGATPITPNIGEAGKETFSFILTQPSFTSKNCAKHAVTKCCNCPFPGYVLATPLGPG